MGQRQVSVLFPSARPQQFGNFLDLPVNLSMVGGAGLLGTSAVFTGGAAVVVAVPLTPSQQYHWKVVGYSIACNPLLWGSLPLQSQSPYGEIPRIIAGLSTQEYPTSIVTDGSFNDATGRQAWVGYNAAPLPNSLTGIKTIYDPETDGPPTYYVNNSNGIFNVKPIFTDINLSIPIDLEPGTQLTFGVWVPSTLLQAVNFAVAKTRAIVFYDDGT